MFLLESFSSYGDFILEFGVATHFSFGTWILRKEPYSTERIYYHKTKKNILSLSQDAVLYTTTTPYHNGYQIPKHHIRRKNERFWHDPLPRSRKGHEKH